MRSPSTRPFPGVVIPPEAEPYCDSRGIVDWAKVAAKLGLNQREYWGWTLPSILKGVQDDNIGVLRRMRDLKLDCVVNSLMASGRRGSTAHSHQRAIKFAQDFDIPLDQVVGSGPNGLVLKRDVVAYKLRMKLGLINSHVSDSRILRQRRILADHLRATLRALRSTRQELADSQNRLAATAEALGEEKTERILEHVARITLSENLKKEQETSARLDSVVRRLSARPRIRRGTTHVEIGGIVFRNRTSTRRSLA